MRRFLVLGILNAGGFKPAFGGIFTLQATPTSVSATGSTFNLEAH